MQIFYIDSHPFSGDPNPVFMIPRTFSDIPDIIQGDIRTGVDISYKRRTVLPEGGWLITLSLSKLLFFREQKVTVSKPDSTEDPTCMGVFWVQNMTSAVKSPPTSMIWKSEEGLLAQVSSSPSDPQ
ncbi:hypothetical protein AVEN_73266-1 [Araneus ventricosus]|uniref:Uncharacterized protein n=1 Tax=Araneus ventricosus TaxID=182803 RepID=A0A4Y2F2Z4_ARAVE|nr:hypothetical protein AVEN_73266-1 [Araneus ventricosus]